MPTCDSVFSYSIIAIVLRFTIFILDTEKVSEPPTLPEEQIYTYIILKYFTTLSSQINDSRRYFNFLTSSCVIGSTFSESHIQVPEMESNSIQNSIKLFTQIQIVINLVRPPATITLKDQKHLLPKKLHRVLR